MMENNKSLNKLLLFAVEILKGRYGLSSEPSLYKFSEEEKKALENSLKILGFTENGSSTSNSSTTFGMEGKDCNYPLKSVFSEIHLSKEYTLDNAYVYPEVDKIPFPQKLNNNKSVISESLKRSFENDYKILHSQEELSNNVLLLFIEKYGGFLPVNRALQSVPFYDYVKILGATFISLLSEKNSSKDKPLMLIGGDLSGIQDFIFSISSKGALKSYRARSFYLGMLSEHTVNKIIKSLNLSNINVVYSSGGGFLILAPNNSKEEVYKIREDLNKWLFNKFRGQIYFSIECAEVTESFEKSRKLLSAKLESIKAKKFSNSIEEILTPREPIQKTNRDECQICYNDLEEDVKTIENSEIRACKTCRDFLDVGSNLDDAKYILQLKDGNVSSEAKFEIENTTYALTDKIPNNSESFDKVWIINSFDMPEFIKLNPKNPLKLLLGNYITKVKDLTEESKEKEQEEFKIENPGATLKEESSASFLGLAFSSIGVKRLAVLRMDVDNLGTIFSEGAQSPISISAISRFLDYYFKYYMNWICAVDVNKAVFSDFSLVPKRDPLQRHVSIIYSGGDDLLIVGAWNEIVELAYDIRKTFNQFVCENPDITISGGFCLSSYSFPFNKAQEDAKKAIDKAKENYGSCDSGNCRKVYTSCQFYDRRSCSLKKNSITMFYDLSILNIKEKHNKVNIAIKWNEAEEIKEFILEFLELFGKYDEDSNILALDGLPRLFIRKLTNIYLMWANNKRIYVIPLVRLLNDTEETLSEDKDKLKKFLSIKDKLRSYLWENNFLGIKGDIYKAHILLKWLDFLTRKTEA